MPKMNLQSLLTGERKGQLHFSNMPSKPSGKKRPQSIRARNKKKRKTKQAGFELFGVRKPNQKGLTDFNSKSKRMDQNLKESIESYLYNLYGQPEIIKTPYGTVRAYIVDSDEDINLFQGVAVVNKAMFKNYRPPLSGYIVRWGIYPLSKKQVYIRDYYADAVIGARDIIKTDLNGALRIIGNPKALKNFWRG